jgi:Flp pilus assembly protein TadD
MAKTARMEKIEAMLADDPADELLRYSLGMEHVSAGDDATAVAVFRELIARSPYVPAFHMAGQALNRLGRVEEACRMLRDGIAAARAAGDGHALGEMEGLLSAIE